MHGFKTLTAALTATTMFVGGLAYATDNVYAADQAGATNGMSQQQQATIGSDAQKMSTDAQLAFADVGHARLSIFDGDTKTAKTLVQNASAAFDRAKTDRSVFMKAEGDLQAQDQAKQDTDKQDTAKQDTAKQDTGKQDNAKKVAWLPVDGAVVLNEDFTADAAKKAAVTDANKKLANGDRKGAMEGLKLAHVDVDFVMAAVPLDETVTDIDQAGKLLQDGKYYETSQLLRKIENSVHYTALDMSGAPKAAHAHDSGAKH